MYRRAACLLVLLAAAASHGLAQLRCVPTDTARECVLRWIPPAPAPDAPPPPPVQTAEEVIASWSGGLSNVEAPIHTALKDFLSALSGSLDTAVLGDNGTALSFGYNLPLALLGAQRQLRLEALFNKPQLSSAAAAIVVDPTAKAELDRSLSSLDDVEASLTFAPATRRFGRGLEIHRALFTEFLLAQSAKAAGIAPEHIDQPLGDPALVSALESLLATGTPATNFGQLVSNQPQVYARAGYHRRRDVIGPRERSATLTLEIATRNLNTFYRSEGRNCASTADCAAALAAYLKRVPSPKQSPRLRLALDYAETHGTDVVPDGATVALQVQPTRRLVYSATYGQPFASLLAGKEGWIDVSYDFNGLQHKTTATTRPLRRALPLEAGPPVLELPPPLMRSAASLTYTQKINDRLLIPISVVYEDTVDYVPLHSVIVSPINFPAVAVAQPEQRLSVHLGVIYRVPSGRFRPASKPCCCC